MKRGTDLRAYLLEALEARQMLSAGVLDTSFGMGGTVALSGDYSHQWVARKVAVQGDGKILVTGYGSSFLSRYQPDGTLDTSFGGGTLALNLGGDDVADGLVVQSDGKIIAADSYYDSAQGHLYLGIVRYNPNGTLDSTFGTGGILKTGFTSGDSGGSDRIALQSDGKILVTFIDGSTAKVARYQPTGTLDNTFGISGIASFADTQVWLGYGGVVVQSDGRIIVAVEEQSASSGNVFIARLTGSGELDDTFSGGQLRLTFDRLSLGALALDSNQRLIIAGEASDLGGTFVTRLTTSGQLDSSFGTDGTFAANMGSVGALALAGDGKILFAGGTDSYLGSTGFLGRLNSNGTSDASFGDSGFAAIPSGAGLGQIRSVALRPDGSIITAGITASSTGGMLSRFVDDGRIGAGILDTTFGTGGTVALPDLWGRKIAAQGDGRILVTGPDSAFLSRYLSDGTLDSSFNGGAVALSLGQYETAGNVVVQPDGKILVGYSYDDVGIVRYNSNGTLDGTFGTGGILRVSLTPGGGDSGGSDRIALQSDGKILLGFVDGGALEVARYQPNGTLDTSFGSAGFASFVGTGVSLDGYCGIAVQSDGRIVVVSEEGSGASNDVFAARLTSTGQVDSTFAGGVVRLAFDSPVPRAIVLDSSQRLVIAGWASTSQHSFVTRLTSTGQLDTSFGTNGTVLGGLEWGYSLALAGDGKIVVGGGNYLSSASLSRLTPSGLSDSSFGTNGLATNLASHGVGLIQSVAVAADGTIITAGLTPTGNAGILARFIGIAANVNQAPTDIALSNTTIAENQPAGTVVGMLSATDPDAGDKFTYSLITGNGAFQIVGNQLKTLKVLSYKSKSSYSILVRVTDSGGLSFEKTFTIGVDRAPTGIALSKTSIAENQTAGTVVGTLSAADPDVGDTATYSLMTGNGAFQIAGSQLKTLKMLNYEAKKSYSVQVRVPPIS